MARKLKSNLDLTFILRHDETNREVIFIHKSFKYSGYFKVLSFPAGFSLSLSMSCPRYKIKTAKSKKPKKKAKASTYIFFKPIFLTDLLSV